MNIKNSIRNQVKTRGGAPSRETIGSLAVVMGFLPQFITRCSSTYHYSRAMDHGPRLTEHGAGKCSKCGNNKTKDSIRVLTDKWEMLKKNTWRKWHNVQKGKKIIIPTFIINFSGHSSGHYNISGHYIVSNILKGYINSNVRVPIERKKAHNHKVIYLV